MSQSGIGIKTDRVWILATGERFGFDCIIREQHAQEMSIPQEPVEDGFVVSDHAYAAPARLSIEGAVTDTPLRPTTGDPFNSDTSRSVTAFKLIKKLAKAAEPFTVVTGLERYDNMLINSISADQEAATSRGLIFRCELTQITIRSTRTVTVPPRKHGKPSRVAAKKVDSGMQTAPAADAPARKSVLLNILGLGTPDGQAVANGSPGLNANILQLLGGGTSP